MRPLARVVARRPQAKRVVIAAGDGAVLQSLAIEFAHYGVILFTVFGNLQTYTRNGSELGMTRLRWHARTRAKWSATTSRRFRTYPAAISTLNILTLGRYGSRLNTQ